MPVRGATFQRPIAQALEANSPTNVYPFYELATRTAWGQSFAEAQAEAGAIWSRNAAVSAGRAAAWLVLHFLPVKLRLLLTFFLALTSAHAVILFRTGDVTANTTAPSGAGYDNSGWQYEGDWGGFLGTPIAPHFFISASHLGNAGNGIFNFQNATYHVTHEFYDPQSDLVVRKVAETFPSFAPLYSRTDEVGKRTIDIGRGTQRGAAVMLNNVLKGWSWGGGDGVRRWGENIVSGVLSVGTSYDLLFANFDQNGLPNECHLSSGDSGGAAFIQDGADWKLAGINYAVDGPFYLDVAGNNGFFAALFDASGFYALDEDNHYTLITGPSPVPTALYPTRISTKLPWICKIVAEPRAGLEAGYLTLTYTKVTLPTTDVTYTVQQSSDLVSWQNSSTVDEVISTSATTQIVKSKVAIKDGAAVLFLRLQIKRP